MPRPWRDLSDRLARQSALSERDYRFAIAQYGLFSDRVTELQKEREVWIRLSIIGTFGFLGWLGVYLESRDFDHSCWRCCICRRSTFCRWLANLGAALRFFFIQRDINRLVTYLAEMERDVLCLPDADLRRAQRARYPRPALALAVDRLLALHRGFVGNGGGGIGLARLSGSRWVERARVGAVCGPVRNISTQPAGYGSVAARHFTRED